MTHENKFGMFIHWGIYAQSELQEQVYARYDWDKEKYEALALTFDPQKYNPEEWVLLAKEAGMKYICFTTKHHDGFCMWDTKYTDYNIMNTPYGKDVLKMLAEACKKHGMLLSLYYSNPDWHHPKSYNPKSSHQWKCVDKDGGDWEAYKKFMLDQITELLTNYGPIYTFFWDIPPRIEDRSLNEYIRSLQPGILINNRGCDEGDFSTPEREYEGSGSSARFEKMTEACNSIDVQSWGYRKDVEFYSYRHLISSIDKIMAKGGSYLLNIGPKADGTLDPEHAERIRKVGQWYRKMEGCLECHEADDFDYGNCSGGEYIACKKDGKTYLHFFNGINSTAAALKEYPGLPKKVRLMNTGKELPFAVQIIPEFFNGSTGRAEHEYLYIKDIPVDDLASEAIVIEISW